MNFNIRTDLAIENREIYQSAAQKKEEIPGIEANFDDSDCDVHVSTVKILSTAGSEALSKPIGEYVTIESAYMNDEVKKIDKKIIDKLSETIKKLTNLSRINSVLVVGLGNSDVTPDALGPKTVEKLVITRHLIEYSPNLVDKNTRAISAIIPGVLGTTGIDTCEIIKGIVEKIHPDLVIVIDALASKEIKRVSKTIQISNAGIVPRFRGKK